MEWRRPVRICRIIARGSNMAVLYIYTGEVLVLYTDGLTESRNAGEEEFGVERGPFESGPSV